MELLGRTPTEPVSHREAARVAGLSPAAFSRFFRRNVGRTYQDYLARLRIGLACRALIETERSVSEVAFASGFGNLSAFNRAFRKLRGVTPREFRALRGELAWRE
jgi:AraC-like DNA-binding protein